MKATIYHNPRCSTSRQTLDILREAGANVTIVDYLQNPPSRAELQRLFECAGMTPREGLRTKEEAARSLADAPDAAILDAMAEQPILIERPLVETEKGVRLARPKERVYDIL